MKKLETTDFAFSCATRLRGASFAVFCAMSTTAEGGDYLFKPLREFAKNSARLIKKCTKPDRKEYNKICFRVAVGFAVMGFIGFFVKLIFIPIN